MRIGITVKFQFSYFSGGGGHTSMAIAEAMKTMGHTVHFLNVEGTNPWWDDTKGLSEEWGSSVLHIANGLEKLPLFDVIFEVDPHLLSGEIRRRVCKRGVWVVRKALLLHDVEATLFPFEQKGRDLKGIQEVWCMDHAVTRDDVQYLEVLTQLPVRLVPWVWSPSAIEAHRKELQMPVWHQIAAIPEYAAKEWSIHMVETNFSASSSATIPLVITREAQLRKCLPFQRSVKIHNADHLKKNDYFNGNVLNHCATEGLTFDFVGRQRVIDFVSDPKSILLAHSRFLKIRPYLLDALWVGIPLIHNSELLSGVGNGCERLFYRENEIGGACDALVRAGADYSEKKGVFAEGALMAIRRELLLRFSVFSKGLLDRWASSMGELCAAPLPRAQPSLMTMGASASISLSPAAPAPAAAPAVAVTELPKVRVGFCDMWSEFNAEYNPFLLLLRSTGAAGGREISGVALTQGDTRPVDLVIFGPFGSIWKSLPGSIPKVHYTGENSAPIVEEGVCLNLGFRRDIAGDAYMRLPLWMLEIDWWGADVARLANPKPLPLDVCTRSWVDDAVATKRPKWCAFVVSNPSNEARNAAFHWMNEKRAVDSAGRHLNTMGPGLFAGLGGGGGELAKHAFLKEYKYCFAYENSSSPGYVTEKLLHAKAAGCIPLYWGDSSVELDFDPKGFVDMRSVKTKEEFWAKIDEVEGSVERWKSIVETPALSAAKVTEVRAHLTSVGERLLALASAGAAPPPPKVQISLAQKPIVFRTAAAASPVPTASPVPAAEKKDPVIFTACNWKFMPSLDTWLRAVDVVKKGVSGPSGLKGVVWMLGAFPAESIQSIQDQYPWVSMRQIPQLTIEGFADWDAPGHYAWKVYVLQAMARDAEFAGSPILYTDAGAFLCRWPTTWMDSATRSGVCLLEDEEQINKHWCHAGSLLTLSITEEELKENQLMAGLQAFVGGHPAAIALYSEAWTFAQKRSCIVGEKWEGLGADGKPFGHRHDQTILSILSKRKGVPRLPLRSVYCDVSLRTTYKTEKAIYCHRGNFKTHVPALPSIDEIHCINLARRSDRWERFQKQNSSIASKVQRFNAYEGRSLTLTPSLARLFRPHDFQWKKAIMGCALSHLELWLQLIMETEDVNSYLILEDDVKFQEGWEAKWEEAVQNAPADFDVIYLGGVLPPNRAMFDSCLEPVNGNFSRVKENTLFGQAFPNRYFHFCNYSYILSRAGAKKIIETLKERDGYWTSADHMICNNHAKMNLYCLTPLVAGCYQDDDPKYATSQFNNYNRVDSFDSDLWNNTDRFSQEDVDRCLAATQGGAIQFGSALEDARRSSSAASVPVPAARGRRRILQLLPTKAVDAIYYEIDWIKELFKDQLDSFEIENWDPATSEQPPYENPIILYRIPNLQQTVAALTSWNARRIPFQLLHLSDEHGQDPIDVYGLPMCKRVFRTYNRPGLGPSVTVLPLGYHHTMKDVNVKKEYVWSFYGTGWRNRQALLAPLAAIQPNKLTYFPGWKDSAELKKEEYMKLLGKSLFVACPAGNNCETFRFYEALEAGAIPLVVKDKEDPFYTMIQAKLPILLTTTWVQQVDFMKQLLGNPQFLHEYSLKLQTAWKAWKAELGHIVCG